MVDSAEQVGKFFLLRHKSWPSFLLEVEDRGTDEGTFVTVADDDLLGREPADYQMWYFDRVTHTLRTKLNDFCMTMDGMSFCSQTIIDCM